MNSISKKIVGLFGVINKEYEKPTKDVKCIEIEINELHNTFYENINSIDVFTQLDFIVYINELKHQVELLKIHRQ
jgi:hypothetical protein